MKDPPVTTCAKTMEFAYQGTNVNVTTITLEIYVKIVSCTFDFYVLH